VVRERTQRRTCVWAVISIDCSDTIGSTKDMKEKFSVLVIGAGSPIGVCVVQRLLAQSHRVTAAYRTETPGLVERFTALEAAHVRLDLDDEPNLTRQMDAADAVVFIPILTSSARAARFLRKDQRAVFFSSNNVAIDKTDQLYQKITESEDLVRAVAPQAVILRPTMIYGHPQDQNLSRLMRAMQRYPILPRPAGMGLQQPVFFQDLADVVVEALSGAQGKGETIAVAGPDVLTVKALYKCVAKAGHTRNLFLSVPVKTLIFAFALMRRFGIKLPLSSAQLERANRDKRPRGPNVVITKTPLAVGLTQLAKALRR